MTRRRRTLAIAAGIVAVAVTIVFWPRTMAARPAPDTVPAEGGAIVVSPIAHGTLQIEHGSQAILVDPTGRAGFDGVPWPLRLNYAGLRPPTIVLVTDDHRDHYDPSCCAR